MAYSYPGVAPTWRLPRAKPRPWSGTARGLGSRIFNAGRAQFMASQPRGLNSIGQRPAVPGPAAPIAPTQQQASPLDAQYYQQLAQNQFAANQRIAGLNALGANEKAALGENLRLLGEQQPILQQGATNRANLQGLLYSGALGRQIGDLQTQYVRSQSRMNDLFAQREAARQAQIEGLNQQVGFDELAARLAAIERASAAAQNAPLDSSGGAVDPGATITGNTSPRGFNATPGHLRVPGVRRTGPGRPRRALVPPGIAGRIFAAGRAQQRGRR